MTMHLEQLDGDDVLAVVRVKLPLDNTIHEKWTGSVTANDCVVIKLQDVPQSSAGVVFGTDEACDVIWGGSGAEPHKAVLHPVNLSIGLDHLYRLVVTSFDPQRQTTVHYNNRGKGLPPRNGQWVIGGHGVPDSFRKSPELGKPPEPWRIQVNLADTPSLEIFPGSALQNLHPPDMVAQRSRRGSDPEGVLSKRIPKPTPRCRGDRYFIKTEVGEGGFGKVIHRWNSQTGEEYAVKIPIVDDDHPFDERTAAGWEREARLMDLARHVCHRFPHLSRLTLTEQQPNIIEFKSAIFSESLPAITLEYAPFGNLRDQATKFDNPITAIETVRLLQQCASALSFLHAHNPPIIHRDIKPENILVAKRGGPAGEEGIVVKLGDFGLAKEMSHTMSLPGSAPYCPPEYFIRQPATGVALVEIPIGVEIDVWSMGLVMLEVLNGRRSWRYNNETTVMNEGDCPVGSVMHDYIVKKLSEFVEGNDGGDFSILGKMLVIDPRQRSNIQEIHDQAMQMSMSAFVTTRVMGAEAAQTPGAQTNDVAAVEQSFASEQSELSEQGLASEEGYAGGKLSLIFENSLRNMSIMDAEAAGQAGGQADEQAGGQADEADEPSIERPNKKRKMEQR